MWILPTTREKYPRMNFTQKNNSSFLTLYSNNNSIFAKEIEDNIYTYEDDSFESEEDIINEVREAFAEVEDFYDEED